MCSRFTFILTTAALTVPLMAGLGTSGPKPAGPWLITGYRQWTKVNPKPVKMDSWIVSLCRLAPELVKLDDSNPHRNKFATIYVNAIGKPAMLDPKAPVFPIGTVIVKEKLPTATSETPELLTVMRKRERGYAPKAGDWEYLVFDGRGSTMKTHGRIAHCQSCHAGYKERDYVVRSYYDGTAPMTYPRLKPH